MLTEEQIAARERKTNLVNEICKEHGLKHVWLSDYCCRINDYLDIWIKSQRWHCLRNNTRGCTGYLETFFKRNINTIKEAGTNFPYKDKP